MKLLLCVVACLFAASVPAAEAPRAAADLYRITNVWEVHLTLTPEQWQALEPRRNGGGGPPSFPGGDGSPTARSWLQGAPGKRNGLSSSMMGVDFEYVSADLTFADQRLTNVALRYKGNGTFMESQNQLKRPLKADLNEFVKGQKMAGVSKLNFQNNVTDAGMMNDALGYRMYRDAGVPAPRTAYARLYVSVPGTHTNRYFGVYTLVENVDDNFTKDRFGAKDGLILKPVTPRPFTDLGADWAAYEGPYDPKDKPTAAQKQRVIEFCQFVSHAKDDDFARRLAEFVDLDNLARFLAVTAWQASLDSILNVGQNYYVFLDPRSQKFSFIPWDLDHSFGAFPMVGTAEQREQLSLQHPWVGENPFLERVYKVPAFQERYKASLAEINRTVARPERLQAQMDEVAAAIRPAVTEEGESPARRFEQVVRGETPAPAPFGGFGGAGGPGGPGGPGPGGPAPGGPPRGGFGGPGMFTPAKTLKPFVVVRAKSVDNQLAGRSEGLQVRSNFGPGGPGGRGGFGPGMFLAPAVLQQGDGDHDGRLTKAEFAALADRWFTAWDTNQSGQLDEARLRAGLRTAFPMPFGPPGAAPAGPPGAPVNRPPGGNANVVGPVGGPGPGGFDPISPIGGIIFVAADTDKNQAVTRAELVAAFTAWVEKWDPKKTGELTGDQLREGMNADWNPFRGGMDGRRAGPGNPAGGPVILPLNGPPGQ